MVEKTRILFVADLNVYSKGQARLRALKCMNFDISALNHTPIGGEDAGHPPTSLTFKIGWKLGFQIDSENVNALLADRVRNFNPHIVWIEKGNMVKASTLALIKRERPAIIIAAYSEDDMFNRANRTHAFTAGLPYYDVVFTTKSYNMRSDELPALGARRCITVDKAFDPNHHMPIEITDAERLAYGADVGFIGTYAPERGRDLLYIAQQGFNVRVWGNGWASLNKIHPKLRVERRALVNTDVDLCYTKAIQATKINLGFLRKMNRDLQTDRSIEIPACGGFMLAEYSDEHARLFEEGFEAIYYRDKTELPKLLKYFLEHPLERKAIAQAGRSRCIDDGYSHANRLKFMLEAALGTPI
ncbi:MAG: hypothetical protein CBB68_07050 [Rhodospirillaceae bacterium TMED8]|nr:hypothetical protein [Magnetovibrio sp.]OUT50751.1 MAG: hypothetical protein CBB68_07050 [Rhodospirillaceae bacterium TMED8]|tara:strand:- start:1285 stop:2358 length:1074 start_codon:yes stop_codon:yes gene_type:complete